MRSVLVAFVDSSCLPFLSVHSGVCRWRWLAVEVLTVRRRTSENTHVVAPFS